MLYAIHTGYVAGYQGTQEHVIHMVTTAETIAGESLPFAFTDGHAEIAFSSFYTGLDDLENVDMPLMRATIWRDTKEDGDRKRRRQAEFLVHNFLPWRLFAGIGVINAKMEAEVNRVLSGADHKPPVTVQRGWYY